MLGLFLYKQLFLVFYIKHYIFNSAFQNAAQIINRLRCDSLVISKSVYRGATYIVLLNQSISAFVARLECFPKRVIRYHIITKFMINYSHVLDNRRNYDYNL